MVSIFMKRQLRQSLNMRRDAVVGRHRTSVCLEEAFWKGLHEIAAARNIALSDLLITINTERHNGNLSSAIRVFVLQYYRDRTAPILIEPMEEWR
jgi:predicted DNA-binding ribbon-helix-helix protein